MCWHVRSSGGDQWPPCSHPPASILIWPGAWICQALLCSLSPSAPGSGYNSAIITGGRVSTKYWWYWQQGRGLWLGGDVLPRMPGLTEWKYCYRGGDKRLAWWAERGQRGWGAIWQSFILGVMTLHFRSFWEINLIRKWSPTVASFEFQMFTMDKHYCRMLGIILQGVTKIISEMFSSSSFHRGLVANIFDSCKSSPLSCFAQSGGFLPSHYPSFLLRIGSGWQGIFIDLDDTLSTGKLLRLDVCQMPELAQFCWSVITMLKERIDGIVEIEMV